MELKQVLKQFTLFLAFLLWSTAPLLANMAGENEIPLVDALEKIGEKYQVIFSYDSELLSDIRIDFEFRDDEQLESVVNRALTKTGLKYKHLGDKYYVIFKDNKSGYKKAKKLHRKYKQIQKLEQSNDIVLQRSNARSRSGLSQIFQSAESLIALINIQGKVSDQSGEPLIGVNILVQGTNQGTVTDIDGNFSVEVEEGATLVFSYIGYIPQEVRVAGPERLEIILLEEANQLNEVVVIGYGSAKKKDLTGAVVRVDLEASRFQPNANPVQSLRGTVAGVTVVDNGRPGSDASIQIRGRNSISASNAPLIVLDGIIYAGGSLSDINQNDIESIDILKDASSSAIFGSRAANGVILITTKKGTTSKPTINFNSYYGMSDFAFVPDYLDAEEYLAARVDGEAADGGPLPFQAPEEANIAAGIIIDPFEVIKRKAPTFSNELSLSGRAERVSYYFSGSYTSVKSPVMGDNFSRISGRVNLDISATDWLKLGTNSGYTANDRSGIRADLVATTYLSPYAELYYDDGVPRPLPMDLGLVNNPLSGTLLDENLNVSKTLFTNTFAEVKLPLPGLSYRLNVGYTQRNSKVFNYSPAFIREAFYSLGSGSKDFVESRNLTLENIVRYDQVFGNDHALNLTFLYGTYTYNIESSFLSSNNIFNDALGYNALEIGENFNIETGAEESKQLSLMGRLGYQFRNKYIFDVTVRRDGYSAFGPGKKFGVFPAVGVSWNVSEEDFLADSRLFSALKLRLSWGKNGNQGVSRYASLSNVSQTNYVFGDGSAPSVGLINASLANPNLGWETTTSLNFGVDFALFSNRIVGAVDVYQSQTKDLLLTQRIPNVSGFETFLRNIGETKNHGVEVSLQTTNIRTSSFSWNTNIAFSFNRNEIVRLTGNDLDGDGVEDDDIASNWFIGEPLGSNYDYVFDGIFQEGDDLSLVPGSAPGHIKFRDLNGDGLITPSDRAVVSNSQPDFIAGITNTFSFKGLSLMVLFNIRQGGFSGRGGLDYPNRFYDLANILDLPYWTAANPNNEYPIINYRNPLEYGFYEDRSFIRLQDVSLSYEFPVGFLEKASISNARIYVSGKNLITWTKWTGWDPEFGSGGRNPGNNGPLLKTYTVGLNLQF